MLASFLSVWKIQNDDCTSQVLSMIRQEYIKRENANERFPTQRKFPVMFNAVFGHYSQPAKLRYVNFSFR